MPSAGEERPSQTYGRRERNAEAMLQSVALSPDGKHVAAIEEHGRLVVWSTETPAEVFRTPLRHGSGGMRQAHFLPDGDLLLFLDGRLERRGLFDERGRAVAALNGGEHASFAGNGHVVLLAGERSIDALDPSTGTRRIVELDWHGLLRTRAKATAAKPLRCMVSCGGRWGAIVFELWRDAEALADDALRLVMVDLAVSKAGDPAGLPASYRHVRFLPLEDGRAVALELERAPTLFERGKPPRPFADAGRRSKQTTAAIETPDGGLLCAGTGGGALWSLETLALRSENRALRATAPQLSIAMGRIAAPQHHSLALFALPSLARIGGAAAHGGEVRFVGVSPRGRQVLSSDLHSLRAWQAQSGETMWEADGQLLAVSPDGSRVAAFHRDEDHAGHLFLLEAATGDRLEAIDGEIVAACLREDGMLVTAVRTSLTPGEAVTFAFCEDVELREGGRTTETVGFGHAGAVFAPDGRSFLVSETYGRRTICFDVPAGTHRWHANGGFPVVSPDGKYVALTTDGNHGIHLYELATGEERGRVTLESWRVVAWGPGDLLLAVSPGKAPRVLRVDRRELAAFANLDPPWLELEGGGNTSTGGAFFADGSRVVMGDERGMLKLWRVDGF